MKFGICTGFEKADGVITIPHLEFIKDCGFNYVELALNAIVNLNDEEFLSLKTYLKDKGIPCLVCNCFMDSKVKMTGDEFDEAIFKSYVETAVNRANNLGCKKLVLGSGGSRNVPSGFPMEKAKKQFDLCMDIIIDEISKFGIQLELEHLNRLESNIVTTFKESTAMAKAKNNPNFKSIIDYFHFALGNEDISLIEEEKEQIGHIHFARPLGRFYPSLADLEEINPFFTAIKNTGYNDTFSMECGFPDMENEPQEYKTILKEIKLKFSTDMVKVVENLINTTDYNCCQSIVCAYADKLGITEEQAFKLSEGFGGGMAGTGGVCGAVTAMTIVAGALTSNGKKDGKANTYQTVRGLIDEFYQKNGSINCNELKGVLTGTPLKSCMEYIKEATEMIENNL